MEARQLAPPTLPDLRLLPIELSINYTTGRLAVNAASQRRNQSTLGERRVQTDTSPSYAGAADPG
jgi:hypothetical protein